MSCKEEVSASQIYNDDEWKHYIDQYTIDETSEISINQSNSETPCDTASNKLLIDQLKAQNDEASQKIIHLEREHDANLNKLMVMLSAIEQMESKMYCTKRLFMKVTSSSGRRWKKYYARVQKKKNL
ncbi:uncharacterized protein LOC112452348 [Temnothorax curvispinosus]|uniref:Uncharacterized protein LOC112452348 n=1 Tax=Temnothorax curvispinosus TaxID=300111 RepID=A0A6J1PFQ7_9HYME|nr:uncharacterized protein LOC112452348 [Temnothorax curvispinosus]